MIIANEHVTNDRSLSATSRSEMQLTFVLIAHEGKVHPVVAVGEHSHLGVVFVRRLQRAPFVQIEYPGDAFHLQKRKTKHKSRNFALVRGFLLVWRSNWYVRVELL